MSSLRVCLAGTWDPDFHRNRALLRMLARSDCDVTVCRVDLWGDRGGAVVRGGKLKVAMRAVLAYPLLAWRFLRTPRPDVVLVPYPGHFDMPLLGALSRLRGAPVVFDMFVSLFDTVVSDRRLVGPRSPLALLTRGIDRLACRLAHRTLADTPSHARFFSRLTGVPLDRFRVLWVGAQENLFRPRPDIAPDPGLVLFYGTFIPLHGVETIVRAAKRVEPDGIRFRIIGDGQERERVERLAADLDVGNLDWSGVVPLEDLPPEIAGAGVCLGIFGTTGKADRVVANKVYQCLSVGRPVVTGDTAAIREAFAPDDVVTVPVADPAALADALRRLHRNAPTRERIAAAGHARFLRCYDEESLSGLLEAHLEELVKGNDGE